LSFDKLDGRFVQYERREDSDFFFINYRNFSFDGFYIEDDIKKLDTFGYLLALRLDEMLRDLDARQKV